MATVLMHMCTGAPVRVLTSYAQSTSTGKAPIAVDSRRTAMHRRRLSRQQMQPWTQPSFLWLSVCQCSRVSQATGMSLSVKDKEELDRLLADDKESEALDLMTRLAADGAVKAFGKGRQVPKRQYTIEELRLNGIDASKLLSPKDKSLGTVRDIGKAAAASGLIAYAVSLGWDGAGQVLALVVGITFALIADQVVNQGGGEALLVDSLGRVLIRNYARRVAMHEAGHFLVAYLLGLLPRAYTLSSWDAFRRYRTLNLQAGTQFCDAQFQKQMSTGKLTASSLQVYTCVALAGVITEALCFGQAEGGIGDVAQLDGLFRALGFTQMKADGEVRWAVLNVASLLRRHRDVHEELADALQAGATPAACIALIEQKLAAKSEDDI